MKKYKIITAKNLRIVLKETAKRLDIPFAAMLRLIKQNQKKTICLTYKKSEEYQKDKKQKNKDASRRYRQTPQGKRLKSLAQRKYNKTEKGITARIKYNKKYKLKHKKELKVWYQKYYLRKKNKNQNM